MKSNTHAAVYIRIMLSKNLNSLMLCWLLLMSRARQCMYTVLYKLQDSKLSAMAGVGATIPSMKSVTLYYAYHALSA